MQDFLVALIVTWILFRLFRPVIFVQWNKPKQYQNYSAPNRNASADGEVTINKTPSQGKNISDTAGEYVDFEEIK